MSHGNKPKSSAFSVKRYRLLNNASIAYLVFKGAYIGDKEGNVYWLNKDYQPGQRPLKMSWVILLAFNPALLLQQESKLKSHSGRENYSGTSVPGSVCVYVQNNLIVL